MDPYLNCFTFIFQMLNFHLRDNFVILQRTQGREPRGRRQGRVDRKAEVVLTNQCLSDSGLVLLGRSSRELLFQGCFEPTFICLGPQTFSVDQILFYTVALFKYTIS